MSSKLPEIYDLAIVGGGFAALSSLAHLVRFAERPFSVCIIASDGFDFFGPAYSTPREEHLLNVRTSQMGLYEGDTASFLEYAANGKPDDYLPRKTFGAYLAKSLQDIYREAREKNIFINIVKDIVDDIAEGLILSHSGKKTAAKNILLATGNSFPSSDKSARQIENVWHFDFTNLPDASSTIAVIGSGLTAVDVIISLHNAGWKGKIDCYSGNGHLPRRHPDVFEKEKIPKIDAAEFTGTRLSTLLRNIRTLVRKVSGGEQDSAYPFYALRPFVPAIWRSLSAEDKSRAMKKYLWLWNIYRHRYAAYLDDILQKKIAGGSLELKRGKVTGTRDTQDGVTLDIKKADGETAQEDFALAFRCVGPSYRAGTHSLIKNMIDKNLLRPHESGFGLKAAEDLSVGKKIYAIGPLLFGEFFETTAVPEIRAQAQKVAKTILARF